MSWSSRVVWKLSPLGILHAQWFVESVPGASIHSEDSGLYGPALPYDEERACARCVAQAQSVAGTATTAAKGGSGLHEPLAVKLARLALSGRVFWPADVATELGITLGSAQQAVMRAAKSGILRRTADGYTSGYRAHRVAEAARAREWRATT